MKHLGFFSHQPQAVSVIKDICMPMSYLFCSFSRPRARNPNEIRQVLTPLAWGQSLHSSLVPHTEQGLNNFITFSRPLTSIYIQPSAPSNPQRSHLLSYSRYHHHYQQGNIGSDPFLSFLLSASPFLTPARITHCSHKSLRVGNQLPTPLSCSILQ